MVVGMNDDEAGGYTAAQRAGAALAILAVLGIAFILADVASGGKLTGGCKDCGKQEEAVRDDS